MPDYGKPLLDGFQLKFKLKSPKEDAVTRKILGDPHLFTEQYLLLTTTAGQMKRQKKKTKGPLEKKLHQDRAKARRGPKPPEKSAQLILLQLRQAQSVY